MFQIQYHLIQLHVLSIVAKLSDSPPLNWVYLNCSMVPLISCYTTQKFFPKAVVAGFKRTGKMLTIHVGITVNEWFDVLQKWCCPGRRPVCFHLTEDLKSQYPLSTSRHQSHSSHWIFAPASAHSCDLTSYSQLLMNTKHLKNRSTSSMGHFEKSPKFEVYLYSETNQNVNSETIITKFHRMCTTDLLIKHPPPL